MVSTKNPGSRAKRGFTILSAVTTHVSRVLLGSVLVAISVLPLVWTSAFGLFLFSPHDAWSYGALAAFLWVGGSAWGWLLSSGHLLIVSDWLRPRGGIVREAFSLCPALGLALSVSVACGWIVFGLLQRFFVNLPSDRSAVSGTLALCAGAAILGWLYGWKYARHLSGLAHSSWMVGACFAVSAVGAVLLWGAIPLDAVIRPMVGGLGFALLSALLLIWLKRRVALDVTGSQQPPDTQPGDFNRNVADQICQGREDHVAELLAQGRVQEARHFAEKYGLGDIVDAKSGASGSREGRPHVRNGANTAGIPSEIVSIIWRGMEYTVRLYQDGSSELLSRRRVGSVRGDGVGQSARSSGSPDDIVEGEFRVLPNERN